MSFVIDADSKLDFGIDWETWLEGDTIASSTWTITPVSGAPAAPALSSMTFDSTTTTCWVDNPVDGENYTAVNHIVTAGGREHDCSLHLRCRAR